MNKFSRNTRAWLAVISCAAGIFWSGALVFGFPGIMGEYWRETFQVTTAATSKITMFILFALGACSFFSGKFHLKHGTKTCLRVGTALIVASMLILLFAKNIYMVYLWAVLNGASSIFIYSPGLATVQRWVPHRKGLVSGLVNLTFGISAAIMSPIFKWMSVHLEYKTMYLVIIVLILVVNLIASCFCEMPEYANMPPAQQVEHDALVAKVNAENSKKGLAASYSYRPKEAIKTRPFWFMCIIWACMGAAGISMVTLSTNYAAYLGMANGVLLLTVFNLTNGLSRIVAGFLSDKIDRQTTGCIAFALATFGYFALNFGDSFGAIAIFAACIGYGFGTLFAVSSPLISDIYGIKYFGMIFGLVFMSYGFLGGILGPNLYGLVLQNTGSYHPIFIYLGVFALIATVLILFVRPLKNRGSEK